MRLLDEMMQDVYKVEIIVSHDYLPKTLELLNSIPVSGYTVIEDTSGKGDRGLSCSDFYCNFNGNYIMAVCFKEEEMETLLEKVAPIIKKAGGVCVVTPSKWLIH